MIRALLTLLIAFFLTFAASLIPPSTLALGCSLTIEPASLSETTWIDPDYRDKDKGGLIVRSSDCEFAKKGRTILIKRPKADSDYFNASKTGYDTYDGKVLDEHTFITTNTRNNFDKGINYLALCRVSGNSATSCNDEENNYGNIYGELTLHAGAVDPIPTGYQLPKIQYDLQEKCIYPIQSDIILKVTFLVVGQEYRYWIDNGDGKKITATAESQDITIPSSNFENPDNKRVCIDKEGEGKHITTDNCLSLKFTLTEPLGDTSCGPNNPNLKDVVPTPIPELPACATFGDEGDENSPIFRCVEVDTAFGRLNVDGPGVVQSLFGVMLGLGGLVAFILIVYSGYQLMTSQGNPEKVKASRERLTSAIVGLLFIIFSLVILQVIGVDILNLPSFKP